jgi:hypothetical protein
LVIWGLLGLDFTIVYTESKQGPLLHHHHRSLPTPQLSKMGKLGRFACIFTPMVMTIGALICLGLVFSGQLNPNNSIQTDLYFFKVRQPRLRSSTLAMLTR